MYIVLGRENCPFCDKAKELLESKDLPYLYVDITEPGFEQWRGWIKANGMTTVPQVFELLPGGYENLYADLEMRV
jgi:glutaredoxin